MRKYVFAAGLLAVAVGRAASAQSTLLTIPGAGPADAFGTAVASAGDVNGDGFGDFIVGAPGAGTTHPGKARVYSGKDGSLLFSLSGENAADGFGTSVAGVGDVDGDGTVDVLVGAPLDNAGGPKVGSATVFSGKSAAVIWVLHGDPDSHQMFGSAVAGAGDVDGDGRADFIVGAPHDQNATDVDGGIAVVFSGKLGKPIFTFLGDALGDEFGAAVAGAGDVDGDGVPDLFVGAPGNDTDGDSGGLARILSGADGSTIHDTTGDSAGDLLGMAVAGLGDVNGDGKPDLLVGSPGDATVGIQTGAAWILSGGTGNRLSFLVGDSAGEEFGLYVAAHGDANGDSFADYAIGSPFDLKGTVPTGSAHIFSGRDSSTMYVLYGNAAQDGFAVVGAMGDADGDGLTDVVIGAPGADVAGSGAGSVRAYSLVPAGVKKFGTGTPGCNGPHFINASEVPSINRSFFKLTCKNAPPSAGGLAIVTSGSDVAGSDMLGIGVNFHVDVLGSSVLEGFFAQSGSTGYGQAPIDIPVAPEFVGLVCYGQFFWLWTDTCSPSSQGVSSSEGLKITVQP